MHAQCEGLGQRHVGADGCDRHALGEGQRGGIVLQEHGALPRRVTRQLPGPRRAHLVNPNGGKGRRLTIEVAEADLHEHEVLQRGVDVRLVHNALIQRALGKFGHESTAVDVCAGPDSAQ
jgi:hypothetical protein